MSASDRHTRRVYILILKPDSVSSPLFMNLLQFTATGDSIRRIILDQKLSPRRMGHAFEFVSHRSDISHHFNRGLRERLTQDRPESFNFVVVEPISFPASKARGVTIVICGFLSTANILPGSPSPARENDWSVCCVIGAIISVENATKSAGVAGRPGASNPARKPG